MRAIENKIPPPLVCLATGIFMSAIAAVTPVIPMDDVKRYLFTAVLALCGVGFLAAGLSAFNQAKTTINPIDLHAASSLVTGGIFRYTRNPMYVGFTFLLLAWSVHLMAPVAFIGPIFFVLFISRFQILPEERVMVEKFGEVYQNYRARVRRWL